MMNYIKKDKGFTLIELLVVISIIGMLSTVVLASLNTARAKARNATRLSDMNQIKRALALYYDKHGHYPTTLSYGENEDGVGECGGWDTSNRDKNANGHMFLDVLVTEGFLPRSPVDPINNGGCMTGFHYQYYRYDAGYSGCIKPFYALFIPNMEGVSGVHPASGKFTCGTYDLSAQAYSYGEFEG